LDEYVYLSDAKLRQFIPTDVRWWSRMRTRKASGSVGMGGTRASLELEPTDLARSAVQLSKVVKHISEYGRWYEEPGLVAGDWVFFEGRIGWQVIDQDPAPGAVLFCQIVQPDTENQKIVLHGSVAHLIGLPSAPEQGTGTPRSNPSMATLLRYSNPASFPSILEWASTSVLPRSERTFWRLLNKTPRTAQHGSEGLRQHLTILLDYVANSDWFLSTAPYLNGCARVTAVVKPADRPFAVVIASPLFIRHQRP
jgi:hypothetical protein